MPVDTKHTIPEKTLVEALNRLRDAARQAPSLTDEKIARVLRRLAERTLARQEDILAANQRDLDRMDPDNPKYDRLLLNPARLQTIADDLLKVAALPSPLQAVLEQRSLPNGLHLQRVSVPIGVIGIVYESRPNVTFDVFALCLKSGNACVLKGSRDAHYSNIAIVDCIREVLQENGLPDMIYLAPSEREALGPILRADRQIDLIIPRGGQGLINYVRQNATVPVIETGAGIVHTYVDASADLQKARAIVENAKTRRVSVCNALDTLLLHRELLASLPDLLSGLDEKYRLIIHADEEAYEALQGTYAENLLRYASEASFGTEFLSMQMSVAVVDGLEAALDHIDRYSSRHSEAVVAESPEVIEGFLNRVDAAVVYANASTAFTDGAQFGLGAEIGISTQKLHARGPMALRELTSYKWVVRGNGQVRPTS